MDGFVFDVAHVLAGSLVLVSFLMLYQDRLYALLNVFALHAVVLALSVAWQAYIQEASHLYITAALALVFKAIVIPVALHRIIKRLGIHREIETVGGVGLTMLEISSLIESATTGPSARGSCCSHPGCRRLDRRPGTCNACRRDRWRGFRRSPLESFRRD